MILTLKELADHLRVNERTILRMLKSGQIQGTKIGGQWRFNSSQIDNVFFDPDTSRPEHVPIAELTPNHLAAPISRILTPARTLLDLQATNVEAVLQELSKPIARESLLLNMHNFHERLLAREHLLSTGVGNGVAVPHPRDPEPTLRQPAVIVFGRSVQGIAFNAVDGKPVHLFFLLCCQQIQTHLYLMGRLATLLRNETVLDGFRNSETHEDVLRVVLESERDQFLA